MALHGTMNRDLDLVAIPWTENPSTHEKLITKLREATGYYKVGEHPWDTKECKPHGRIAYTVQTGGGGYLNLSIMPSNLTIENKIKFFIDELLTVNSCTPEYIINKLKEILKGC